MRLNLFRVIPGRGCGAGVVGSVLASAAIGARSKKSSLRSKPLESGAGAGDSPVDVRVRLCGSPPK